MAFGSGSGRGGQLSDINVTPMVDIMLVLLIIFMVATPMLTTGLEIDLPKAEAPRLEITEDEPIITIQKDESIYLFDEKVDLAKLREKLRSDPRVKKAGEVYVQADDMVHHGVVVRVLAIVREAGISKMGIVTDPRTRPEE